MSSNLTKPTLSKPILDQARDFAEGRKARDESKAARNVAGHGQRVFFAPEGYRRLTINLPENLHKKLKMAALEQDCTATEIIERLLTEELK